MRRISLFVCSLFMLASLQACAQSRKTAASGSADPVILEATERRTKPGRPEMSPHIDYRFRVIWKGKAPAEKLYWRPDASEWMEVTVAKPYKRPGLGPNDFMVVEKTIKATEIRAGDTLILTTRHSHDHDLMPSAVKKLPVKALIWQSSGAPGKWVYKTVSLRRLPDFNAP